MNDHKVVLITGAGSGIGAGAARRFAAHGYKVVLNGRTESKLRETAQQIEGETTVAAGDVSDPDQAASIIKTAIDAYGQLDVLVNNAGTAVMGGIADVSVDDFDQVMSTNVRGPFLMIKHALPYLKKSHGNIVNTASVSGLAGDWQMFAYNASKGAVSLMTQALALDLAQDGIRVNAVAPSLTRSEMTDSMTSDDQIMTEFSKRMPMDPPAEPEDIADVMIFLASDAARFVTGVVLPVDGGVMASNGQPNLA